MSQLKTIYGKNMNYHCVRAIIDSFRLLIMLMVACLLGCGGPRQREDCARHDCDSLAPLNVKLDCYRHDDHLHLSVVGDSVFLIYVCEGDSVELERKCLEGWQRRNLQQLVQALPKDSTEFYLYDYEAVSGMPATRLSVDGANKMLYCGFREDLPIPIALKTLDDYMRTLISEDLEHYGYRY